VSFPGTLINLGDCSERHVPIATSSRPAPGRSLALVTIRAVLFDWGGTLTPWHNLDLYDQWPDAARTLNPENPDLGIRRTSDGSDDARLCTLVPNQSQPEQILSSQRRKGAGHVKGKPGEAHKRLRHGP